MKKYIIIDVYLNPAEKYESILAEVLYRNKNPWLFDVYVKSHLTLSDVRFVNCPDNIYFRGSRNSLNGMSVSIYKSFQKINGYYYIKNDVFEAENDEDALLLYKLYDKVNE